MQIAGETEIKEEADHFKHFQVTFTLMKTRLSHSLKKKKKKVVSATAAMLTIMCKA